LALVVDTSIGGRRMARELDTLIARRGKPTTIVSDNGTEMTFHAVFGPTAPGSTGITSRPASRSNTASSRALEL
jgi:hypothetical protein